jgi:hypothetical protein
MARWMLLGLFSLTGLFGSLPAVFLAGCRKDAPPQPYVRSIELKALDASCTEAWLKITLTDSNEPRTVKLTRDDSVTVFSNITLRTSDTLVIDEGLLPNRTYTYRAYRLADSRLIDSTTQVTLTTLDTTSHNWTFVAETLGTSSSVLYDVAIVRADPDSPLVYAVGEIYIGSDPQAYNMVRWDGDSWELMRIQFYTICGQSSRTPYPASSVFAFSETDVWISSRGGQLARWNGTTQTATICNPDPFVINKLWGENSNSIWAVGNDGQVGRIGHYASGTWRRIESGTTLPIMDIYGARDPRTGRYEILCVAEAYGVPGASKIFTIENGNARELTTSGLESWGVAGIWFVPDREYIVAGQGVWRSRSAVGRWWWDDTLPRIATTSIRGQNLNDMVVSGAFWLLAHWNGVRWQTYFPRTNNGGFVSVAIKGNMLVAVGGIGGGIDRKALLLIAHRR